jgi:hypothetical protein
LYIIYPFLLEQWERHDTVHSKFGARKNQSNLVPFFSFSGTQKKLGAQIKTTDKSFLICDTEPQKKPAEEIT